MLLSFVRRDWLRTVERDMALENDIVLEPVGTSALSSVGRESPMEIIALF